MVVRVMIPNRHGNADAIGFAKAQTLLRRAYWHCHAEAKGVEVRGSMTHSVPLHDPTRVFFHRV